jgi:hypothetical protein
MSKLDVRFWSHTASMLALAGCVSACAGSLVPVLNIQNAPVLGPRGQEPPTRDQVHDAVMRALSGRGWQVNSEDANGVTATIVNGRNSATMHVQYDERYYSIHYVDSSPSLGYNGDEIHHRYNDWVDKLSRAIRWNLMALHWGRIQVIVSAPGQPPAPALESPPPAAAAPTGADPVPPPDQVPPLPPSAAPHK